MNDPFKGRWVYCVQCECPAIICTHCHNASCSGGGCEKCYDEFELAIYLVNEGKITKDDIGVEHAVIE